MSLVAYFKIFHVEGRCDDFPMVSPFFPFEAEQAIAFKLPNQRVSFIFLIELGF